MEEKAVTLDNLVERVVLFNVKHGIVNPPTMWNLSYLANCLTGETGEIANAVKKMLRDGITDKQRQNLYEEIVDNQIYIAMLIDALDMNFDEHFEKKMAELEERFANRIQRIDILENITKEWQP